MNADRPRRAETAAPEPVRPAEFVVGVDGGGSKTLAWLAARQAGGADQPIGVGEAGPGNPRAAGFEVAQHNIAAAIRQAWAAAGREPQRAAAACLGLSGAGRPEEQQRIRDWALAAGIAGEVQVTHDAEIILAAGSRENSGVALICGTGSLAWGRSTTGAVARAGGWGYLIGDEGSAYAVVREGLRAAAMAADGRGPATALLAQFQRRLQAAAPEELIGRIYHAEMTRETLSRLADVVFECATSDAVAERIIRDAAAELASMVTAVVRHLHLTSGGYELALTGGLLLHQPQLQDRLQSALAALNATPLQTRLVTDPVRGAVTLARRLVSAGE